MKNRQCFQRIPLMIWVLITIALLTIGITVALLTRTLWTTQKQRTALLQQQQREASLLEDLSILGHTSQEELTHVLYNTRDQDSSLTETTHYLALLASLPQRTDLFEAGDSWKEIDLAIRRLTKLVKEVPAWRARYTTVENDLLENRTVNAIQEILQRLQSAVESAEGRERLTEARQFRRWRQSSGTEAQALAQSILKKRGEIWFPLLTEAKVEVSQLATLVARLSSEKSIDHLDDIKDNQIKPSLDRLERNILILEEENVLPAGESMHLLTDLKDGLFGKGHRIDQEHQTIETRGGLFTLCLDNLNLLSARVELEHLIGKQFDQIEMIYPQLAKRAKDRVDMLTRTMESGLSGTLRNMALNGGLALAAFLGLGSLISLRVRQQVNRLAQISRHHDLILNSAGEGILGLSPEGSVTFVNRAGAGLLGFSPDELIGKSYRLFCCPSSTTTSGCDADKDCIISRVWEKGDSSKTPDGVFYGKDGSSIPVEYVCSPLLNENRLVEGAVIAFSDITERKMAEQALVEKKQLLDHIANHDPLTELPNRRLFHDRFYHALDRARRNDKQVALLFIDLDRFKKVNDTLGHEIGDRLLSEISQRLGHCVRHSDTLARLGGDEFVLLLEDSENANHDAIVARKILTLLADPFCVGNHQIYITASVGISRFPEDAQDVKGLTGCADAAMYHAKMKGKNTFQFYTPELNRQAEEFLEVETRLRAALKEELFTLHYQPQIDLESGILLGAEALLRWCDPVLGTVSPDRFIPLAEESGLIIPLGRWVLQAACKQNKSWQDAGLPVVPVSVNISGVQFGQTDFVDEVDTILLETGLSPQWLELEITESAIMEDFGTAIMTLTDLKVRGISLAIDDFGTGYSSLSYLKQFPVSKLKIDRSFISDVLRDDNAAAIASSIVALGRTMNLTVVAEGIEEEGQVEFLKKTGCGLGQGYFYAKPMPQAEFEQYLKRLEEGKAPLP